MTQAFNGLCDTDLRALIAGLRSGRIEAPYSELQVARVVRGNVWKSVHDGLNQLGSSGFNVEQICIVLELLISDRQERQPADIAIDLVTSGPEAPGITNRDTSVVVRELFAHAQKSVLVVGYAIYQGQRVFESLARRMADIPGLEVQLFVNISRPEADTTAPEILVSRFVHRFKETQWPAGYPLPEVYFDPRSIAEHGPVRSSLHAKCIVVDAERVFVSSANFTAAAQERNIEVGLNIKNHWLATQLISHFKQMHAHDLLRRAI